MNSNLHDIFEYLIALINEFARKFGLSDKQAFNYINRHQGIDFVVKNYGILHTLDFDEAVDSVAQYCRRTGGEL